MFEIEIQQGAVRDGLAELAQRTEDMTPAMRAIAAALADETEQNFAEQGRPRWLDLAESTKERRAKAGHWPGPILQVSGRLAASITTEHSPVMAAIGSNVIYAARQQLGDDPGEGAVHIPARPYLPITVDGALHPAAESAVLDAIERHLGLTR